MTKKSRYTTRPVEETILESTELKMQQWQKEVLAEVIRFARKDNPWLKDQGDDLAIACFAHFELNLRQFTGMNKDEYTTTVRNYISDCLGSKEYQRIRLIAKGYDEEREIEHVTIDDLIAEGDEYVIPYLSKSKDIGDQVDFAAFCDFCKCVKRFLYVKYYLIYGNVREAAKALTKKTGHTVSRMHVHRVLTWLVKNFPW